MYDIREFGAKGDREQNDQPAIQAAIDACKGTGGTVLIPPGDYLTSSLHLASNVEIRIATGATLWVSTDREHYEPGGKHHLFEGSGLENVSITGGGTINGQGSSDFGHLWGITEGKPFGAGVLLLDECRGVRISDIKIVMSGFWTLHFRGCSDVVVRDVSITNHLRRIGCDGIDVDSCSDVRISGCRITAGDDCIVLKTTTPTPCRRVIVSDCILESKCTALKIGSETLADFTDIKMHSCVIHSSAVGIGLYIKDGGCVDGLSISDVSIETLRCADSPHPVFPVFIDIEQRHADTPLSRIRNVSLEGILARSGSNFLIQGMPVSPVQNLRLRNASLLVTEPVDFSDRYKAIVGMRTQSDERDYVYARVPACFTLAHVEDLLVDSLYVSSDETALDQTPKSLVSLHSVRGGRVVGVQGCMPASCSDIAEPEISLNDCSEVSIEPKQ